MTTETNHAMQDKPNSKMMRQGGGDAFYGIGLFGAWFYFFSKASTTEERIGAFFKGLFWPAFLVYKLFVFLEQE